ncbi:MAG: kynureninase [Acidimicrobiia bacterium]
MTRTIYLDGNSLGPPMPGVVERLQRFVEQEWATALIRGWNEHRWWELPLDVGEQIAPLVGAAPGQVVVADTTTVLLYKLLVAALRARPGRPWIVTHEANFPTDRHVIDAVAEQFGARVEAVPASGLAAALCDGTAVLCATHVDYRTGARLDTAALTAAAHDVGALALWDLSHSTGAMDLHLDRDGVDLAVGCTYKYLNGGPGAPAFAYVAEHLLGDLDQPVSGWVGHAAPFTMDERHVPAPGIRRLLSGTPPVMSLIALSTALDAFRDVDLAALRERSLGLTDRFIALADERLADHGFAVVTPRDRAVRGSHVSLAHEHAHEVIQAAIAVGVIGDYREPGLCRFGFAPLYVTLDDVDEAVDRLVDVMERGAWRAPEHAVRGTVT